MNSKHIIPDDSQEVYQLTKLQLIDAVGAAVSRCESAALDDDDDRYRVLTEVVNSVAAAGRKSRRGFVFSDNELTTIIRALESDLDRDLSERILYRLRRQQQ